MPSYAGLCGWGRRFFPEYFVNKSPPMHYALGKTLLGLHERRGSRYIKVAPRGSAKSVYTTFLDPLYAICEKKEKYILILSDTYGQAVKHLKAIRSELEYNSELALVYPEACGVGSDWSDDGILTRNGVRVEPLGTAQKIRGRREGAARPSLIIVDDPQNDDIAFSTVQRLHDWEWLTKGVFKAGGPSTNIIVVGTKIHNESIVGKLQGAPGWKTDVDRSIESWPLRMDLWEQWEGLICNASDPLAADKARDFYQLNEEVLHEGAAVLWEDREPLIALMTMRAIEGHASFESEKQNNPIDPSKCEWGGLLDGDIWFDTWPKEVTVKTMAMDPSGGSKSKTGDYSAIVKLGKCDNLLYVEADLQRRDETKSVQDLLNHQRAFGAAAVGIEADLFQHLIAREVIRMAEAMGMVVPVVPIMTKGIPKPVRIRRIGPYVNMRALRFKRGSPGTMLLLRQMQEFPNGDYDDGPDALDMAIQLGIDLLNGVRGEQEAAEDRGFIEFPEIQLENQYSFSG